MSASANPYATVSEPVLLERHLAGGAADGRAFFEALVRVSASADDLLDSGARLSIGANARGELVLPIEISGSGFGGAIFRTQGGDMRLQNLDTENAACDGSEKIHPGAGSLLLSGVLACFVASGARTLSWVSSHSAIAFYR